MILWHCFRKAQSTQSNIHENNGASAGQQLFLHNICIVYIIVLFDFSRDLSCFLIQTKPKQWLRNKTYNDTETFKIPNYPSRHTHTHTHPDIRKTHFFLIFV